MQLILTSPVDTAETKALGTRNKASPRVSSEVTGGGGSRDAWGRQHLQFTTPFGEVPPSMWSAPSAQRSPPGLRCSEVRNGWFHDYAVFWEVLKGSVWFKKK